jgi:hypothetical protein
VAPKLGAAAEVLGVKEVDGADVEGGRDTDMGATVDKALGKLESGVAVVEATVDVRRSDVEQVRCLIDAGHRTEDRHRHLYRGPCVTVEFRAVVVAEGQGHGLMVASRR